MRFTYSQRKMAKLFANSGDPDQMPHSAASDLGLHCLPVILLPVSRLQWVNSSFDSFAVMFVFLQAFMLVIILEK